MARLRLAVMQLAFYTADYAAVVRHAREALPRLVAGKRDGAQEWEGEFLKVTCKYKATFQVRDEVLQRVLLRDLQA